MFQPFGIYNRRKFIMCKVRAGQDEPFNPFILIGISFLMNAASLVFFYFYGVSADLASLFFDESKILETVQNLTLLIAGCFFLFFGKNLSLINRPLAYFMGIICITFFLREVELLDYADMAPWMLFPFEGLGRLWLLIPLGIQIRALFLSRDTYLRNWKLYTLSYSGIFFLLSLLCLAISWPFDRIEHFVDNPSYAEELLELNAYLIWLFVSFRIRKDSQWIDDRLVNKNVA